MPPKPWYELLFWELVSLLTSAGLGQGAVTYSGVPPTLYDKEAADEAIRATIVAFCDAQVGEIYKYAIEHGFSELDPEGWDCSELAENAYNRAGLAYPDGCVNQKAAIGHRRVIEPLAGDVFFYGPNAQGIPHTGIYTGRGTAINALGGKVGMVVEQDRAAIEAHPRFEGWYRHTDLAYPPEARA